MGKPKEVVLSAYETGRPINDAIVIEYLDRDGFVAKESNYIIDVPPANGVEDAKCFRSLKILTMWLDKYAPDVHG
jgi:hypothetical protein